MPDKASVRAKVPPPPPSRPPRATVLAITPLGAFHTAGCKLEARMAIPYQLKSTFQSLGEGEEHQLAASQGDLACNSGCDQGHVQPRHVP